MDGFTTENFDFSFVDDANNIGKITLVTQWQQVITQLLAKGTYADLAASQNSTCRNGYIITTSHITPKPSNRQHSIHIPERLRIHRKCSCRWWTV